ncbi:hypothetical protein [Streptomyces sp. N2A]|uniref:hypothetical protein n=1 Tax=Streptomyces sp. N2A TaxID=3073936 RepID=UPI0028708129|nr:hypothetical protein [Streptomyces sp. N2A]
MPGGQGAAFCSALTAQPTADDLNKFCGDADAEKLAACTCAITGVVAALCTLVAVDDASWDSPPRLVRKRASGLTELLAHELRARGREFVVEHLHVHLPRVFKTPAGARTANTEQETGR